MTLRLLSHIKLPANRSEGGFDHADIHPPTDRLYVAHTSNDAIDVIDGARDQYIESISGFGAVAGTLVSEARGLVFTSNRGENTVSVFAPGAERDAFKIAVGVKPNGRNINRDCGALHPEHVKTEVVRKGAMLGIALDGDADRVIMVDERGQVVDGDAIMALCASRMLRQGRLKKKFDRLEILIAVAELLAI